LIGTPHTRFSTEIDKDTFDYMWQLSEPDKGPAEGCFLRLKQEELYEDGHGNGNVPDFYPDVGYLGYRVLYLIDDLLRSAKIYQVIIS
jgi:hypothetical protein